MDYLCIGVEDAGVDNLFPLGVGTKDLELNGELVASVGDVMLMVYRHLI